MRTIRHRLWIPALLVVLVILAGAAGVSASGGQQQIFVGTDPNGNFQAALGNALAQATLAAGCCDIRIEYKVLSVKGTVGGFITTNEIRVTIRASWPA